MPQYKLTYFNAKARAEVIRMLFKVAEVEFEDYRTDHSVWPNIKASTPFGQLPMLEIDGEKLGQSHAIEMYVAKEFGLAGDSALEEARVSADLCTIKEMAQNFITAWTQKDEAQKELKQKSAVEEAEKFLTAFEKRLAHSDHLVGSKLSASDISLTVWLDSAMMAPYFDGVKDHYPKVKALTQRVNAVPAIKKWIETRPQTKA